MAEVTEERLYELVAARPHNMGMAEHLYKNATPEERDAFWAKPPGVAIEDLGAYLAERYPDRFNVDGSFTPAAKVSTAAYLASLKTNVA